MSRRVLLIRHASAVPRGSGTDAARPLTARGRRRFAPVARALARLLPRPDLLLTSPWTRARETADLLAHAWGDVVPREALALTRGDVRAVSALLEREAVDGLVVLVGHEPHLAGLLAHALGSGSAERLTFRKGGAALIELPDALVQGGRLVWFLPPKLLRCLDRAA